MSPMNLKQWHQNSNKDNTYWDAAALWTPKISTKKNTMTAWRFYNQYHKDNTWRLGQQKPMFVKFKQGNITSQSEIFNLKLFDFPEKIVQEVEGISHVSIGLIIFYMMFMVGIMGCLLVKR